MNKANNSEQPTAQYLSKEIEKSIAYFSKRSKINRVKTGGNKICSIVFSGLITMVLGLKAWGNNPDGFAILQTNIALGLGLALTITNGIDIIFNYKKLWIRNEKTYYSLQIVDKKVKFALSSGKYSSEVIGKLF